ncbi:Cyclase-like protein 1 [Linum perenne]
MSNNQLNVAKFLVAILLATYGNLVVGHPKPCAIPGTRVPLAQEREVYGPGGRIIDVSHRITPEMPKFGLDTGVGTVVKLVERLVDGDLANVGEINSLGTHTGTHVDSPGHFCQDYYLAGYTVGSLDLYTLNGIDYLSISIVDDATPVHRTFLKRRDIIPVEGMNLDNVEAGEYDVHCLPLRLIGADGTPSRCIAIKPQLKTAVV